MKTTIPHRRFFALTILMVVISLLVAPYAYATTSPAPAAPAAPAAVDMSKTYVNPLNLSYMEVASNIRSMAATDAGIADTTGMLPYLAKPTWVEADGRSMNRQSSVGLGVLTENNYRTMADLSAVNYDGTIYLYASGDMQSTRSNNTEVWTTTDYIHWERHQMNLGITAPTGVHVGNKYYLAGNGSPLYESDSPFGPWTSLGNFLMPDGTTLRKSDVQFFLDTDGRLYLSYNIGAPIMAAELDPNNPRQLISEPVVVFDFDASQEWEHFGENKQHFTYGYVEASQIFKVDKTYYLQVGAGGTESTSYNIGVFKSKTGPLTGYQLQDNNPIGREIGGLHPTSIYPDAGHGSFVQDNAGNLLVFYTYVIAYETGTERRGGMDSCYLDNKDNIHCTLTNTPQTVPTSVPHKVYRSAPSTSAGLYNISDNTSKYWASSYAPGRTPYYAADRSLSTWWQPADSDTVREFILGFAGPFYVSAAQFEWKELGSNFTLNNAVKYTLEYKDINSNQWVMLVDKSANATPLPVDYATFPTVFTNAVRLYILGTTENVPVGVQELRVFGESYTLAAAKGMNPFGPTK